MSVVCAVHQNGETWIGSDSLASRGDALLPATVDKWMRHGHAWIGHAGDARVMTIIEHAASDILAVHSPFSVAEALRTILPDYGVELSADCRGAKSSGQSFILATPASVYAIDGTFHFAEIDHGWLHAIGSGGAEAEGAGFALQNSDPKTRVIAAVQAACALDAHCGGTVFFRRVEYGLA